MKAANVFLNPVTEKFVAPVPTPKNNVDEFGTASVSGLAIVNVPVLVLYLKVDVSSPLIVVDPE